MANLASPCLKTVFWIIKSLQMYGMKELFGNLRMAVFAHVLFILSKVCGLLISAIIAFNAKNKYT